jgi:hypothetical protein
MKPPVLRLKLVGSHALTTFCASSFGLFLMLAIAAPTLAQETNPSSESVADAAKNAREHKPNPDPTKPAKVLTNEDLAAPAAVPAAPASEAATAAPAEEGAAPTSEGETAKVAKVNKPICPNADEEQANSELQAAQDELEQLRRQLSPNEAVISNGDVDLSNFKQGGAGLSFDSPPLSDAVRQSPGRVQEVELEEKVAALKKAARISCDSPKEAEIQGQLDSVEAQLKLLLQQFSLDQSAYYSKPDYSSDTAGKAKLDAEQQQIQELKDEVERLRQELPAPSPTPEQPTE